jgi:hypothetical protein
MKGDVKRLIFKATIPGEEFFARDLAKRLGLTAHQVGMACRALKDKAFEIARPRDSHEQKNHLWRRIHLKDLYLYYLTA